MTTCVQLNLLFRLLRCRQTDMLNRLVIDMTFLLCGLNLGCTGTEVKNSNLAICHFINVIMSFLICYSCCPKETNTSSL